MIRAACKANPGNRLLSTVAVEVKSTDGKKSCLFQAPPLPTHFVERPEYSHELKTRLLTKSTSNSRALVITAIHGLGSVGKSTLATALAHDPEVQTCFCDGILWATLGQQPDVLSLLSGWVQALGDYSFKPTNVEATSTHLQTLLYDKAVLLVVDDAWNTKDAQAFKVGGSRCQVLVTTREASIADALGVRPYNLGIMKPHQAMELLTNKLEREITSAEQSESDRARVLSSLAEKLPEVLSEALAAAREIQSESDRADVLSSLAEKLPPQLLPEALAAAREIQSEYSGTDVLRALALGLSQTPSATLFPLWRDILHELSLRTRPNLLRDINALFPVILALGSEAVTAEVARAIEDVGRWWR